VSEEREPTPEQLQDYLRKIERIPPLTQEEEAQLVHQFVRGRAERGKSGANPQVIEQGEQAHHRLIEASLPMLVSIARTYLRDEKALSLMDLIDAGKVGLNHATEQFDPAKGYDFTTYATWWIRQAITRAVTS